VAVFIELTTEAFEDEFRKRTGNGRHSRYTSRAGRRRVRRPQRGIEIKEDTYSIIKVIQADGNELPLFDSSSPDGLTTTGYANFLMQSVTEARMEKHQIVETFGDSYVFFFGENPRFLDIQAVVLNTHDFNWEAEWWENYNTYLRGTKLVELGARIYIFYDDVVVEGYMLQAQASKTADAPYIANIAFKLFVTNYSNISFVQPPDNARFPIRSSVQLPDNIDLTQDNAAALIQSVARQTQLEQLPGDTITDAVRAQMRSVGFPEAIMTAYGYAPEKYVSQVVVPGGEYDPDTDTTDLSSIGIGTDLIKRKDVPLRGNIAENLDEYTGLLSSYGSFSFDNPYNRPPPALKGTARNLFEVEDLFREAIEFLSCYGADANDPAVLIKLGLGPNFAPEGSVNGATFNPLAVGDNASALYGGAKDAYNRNKNRVTDAYDQFTSDPLDAVFGRPESEGSTFGPNRPKYTEGAGDPLYGYPSDFADGPGYGQAGFGDFGGLGFGSGSGETGDPGFKDPSKFTFAGVANAQSAFDRFMKKKEDNTSLSLNAGATLGTSGLTGGAVVNVDGEPSAFALVSVPGLLDETGQARQAAEAIAEKQASQRFGFGNNNPYGVNCPSPADIGIEFSLP
jgi:hypothetical protein